ncbi:MAG: hypothetical protein U1E15_01225 [Hyphomicrobiales bacterium]
MNKNTPKIIFTGLAVAAAGVLGAVATGTVPQALLSQLPAQTSEQAPAQQPAAQPKVEEAPAAAESQPAQPAAPAQQSASADPQAQAQKPVAAAEPAPAAEPAAETAPAAAKIQDRFPSFDTVRVDPAGDAVIAGHAAPGSEVTIKFAGQEVGKATANAEGSFVFVPDKPLPAGAGALSLEAVVNGEKVASADQVAIVVQAQPQQPALVAKVDPAQPTQIVQSDASGAPPKDVEISAVDYDDRRATFSSVRVPVGNIVRFYVDNTAIGDARPDDKGHWLFKATTPLHRHPHAPRRRG